MKTCKNCGEKFSDSIWRKFFADTDICPECRQAKKEKVQQYVDKVVEFGEDNYLDHHEEEELGQMRRRLGLKKEDLKSVERKLENLRQLTKQANIKKFEDRLREVGADGYLDSEEDAELCRLVERFGLTHNEISHTLQDLISLKKLTAIQDGNLTIIGVDINLMEKEACYYEIPAKLMEGKPPTENKEVSIQVTKDVCYQVGGFKGKMITAAIKEIADRGSLYLTNKRIVFVGGKKNVTYPLSKIISLNKYANAIQFLKEKEDKPKYFIFENKYAVDEILMTYFELISERRG